MLINSRYVQLACMLLVLASCRAPMSYINSVPESSLLEEKGDFNVKFSSGADFTFEEKTFLISSNWAPHQNFGISWETSFLHHNKSNSSFFSYLKAWNIGLVYFKKLDSKSGYEIKSGYGKGGVQGAERFSTYKNDYFDPFNFYTRDKFKIDSDFQYLFFQPSVYLYPDLDTKTRVALGMRTSLIQFEKYYFESMKYGIFEDKFSILSFDPFLQTTFYFWHFGVNTSLTYSFRIGDSVFAKNSHPNYKRFAISVGVLFRLNKD